MDYRRSSQYFHHHTPPAPLVFINGWPGVGKQTVAETLAMLLGDAKAFTVDAHELQDDQNALLADPSRHYAAGGRRPSTATAGARVIESLPDLGRIAILTDCQPDTAGGRAAARSYAAAAARSGRPFVPVYMDCAEDENMRRVVNSERHMRGKLMDPGAAQAVRAEAKGRLFVYDELDGLELDATDLGAHETALAIMSFVNDQVASNNSSRNSSATSSAATTPGEIDRKEWR